VASWPTGVAGNVAAVAAAKLGAGHALAAKQAQATSARTFNARKGFGGFIDGVLVFVPFIRRSADGLLIRKRCWFFAALTCPGFGCVDAGK